MKQESEDLLQKIVTGDVPFDAPEVTSRSEADEEFAEELAATRAILDRLQTARREREDVLGEARTLEDGPGQGAVRAFVARRTAAGDGKLVTSARIWLAAAAVLVTALMLLRLRGSDPAVPDTVLGPAQLVLLEPIGAVTDYERFAWESSATNGWFVVVVTDVTGRVLEGGHSDNIEGRREWQPPKEALVRWPEEIEWELRWYDGAGDLQETAYGEASL